MRLLGDIVVSCNFGACIVFFLSAGTAKLRLGIGGNGAIKMFVYAACMTLTKRLP